MRGFFDRPPDPENEGDTDDWFEDDEPQPALYLGGVVPLEAIVARSETAAVALRGLIAYPDGFELTVSSWTRPQSPRERRRSRRWRPAFLGPMDLEPGEEIPAELLRFGVQFPDEASVTNLDAAPWRLSADATEPAHGLEPRSAEGSEHEFSQVYWIWPLPEPGTLSFVTEWPAFGITESRYDLAGELVREAAGRAQPVWPDLTGPIHITRSTTTQHFGRMYGRGSSGGPADDIDD